MMEGQTRCEQACRRVEERLAALEWSEAEEALRALGCAALWLGWAVLTVLLALALLRA